jgi:hypothetical protein
MLWRLYKKTKEKLIAIIAIKIKTGNVIEAHELVGQFTAV